MPWDREAVIEVTLQWAGAAELPEDVDVKRLEKTGSPFTRGFEIEFSSNPEALKQWVSNSKMVKFASKTTNENRITTYLLTPALEGAQYAKVKIDWITSSVFIKVYWS